MAYSDEVRTAQEVLSNESAHGSMNDLEAEAVARAEAAGVTRSEYVGYADGFALYEARSDVEPLNERRLREAASSAAETDFRREGEGSGAVFTSPKDGNVGGLVGDDGDPIDTPGDETDPEGPA